MKRKLFWIAVSMFMIILPTLTACDSAPPAPDDPLNGTHWNLIFYRKTSVIEGTNVTANFENGDINGAAGCNSYFGGYQIDGENISFSQIGMTEMYCSDPEGVMEQEGFYLDALAIAQRYEIADGHLTVFLRGHETLTFEPTN
jgi:heat shock protein HslJ